MLVQSSVVNGSIPTALAVPPMAGVGLFRNFMTRRGRPIEGKG
jgi:hypothetical protein